MASKGTDSVLLTIPIVLLVVVVAGVLVKLSDDEEPVSAPPVPSASFSVPSGTPADGSPRPSGPPTATSQGGPGSTPPSATSTVCVADDQRTRFSVLTFNIHSARAYDGTVRLATVAEEIARWDADVVLLQEVDRGREWTGRVDMPAVLAKQLDMSWTFGANVRRSATNQYGTAILSRFPIVDSRNVPLPAPPGTQQRGLLAATLDVDGTEVGVYDTHLENTSRVARLQQMRTIAKILRADQRPTILGGDLNAFPDSSVLATARGFAQDTWSAVGSGPGYTASARDPRNRIDYLLYDGGDTADLDPTRAVVLRSAVSDHLALWAAYRLVTRAGEICVPVLDDESLP
ncbi:MAG: endonuclease/exonuclease/phosphatase family protein [Nocardioides sp.]